MLNVYFMSKVSKHFCANWTTLRAYRANFWIIYWNIAKCPYVRQKCPYVRQYCPYVRQKCPYIWQVSLCPTNEWKPAKRAKAVTVWKNEKLSLTWKIFRQINSLVTYLIISLLSRNFCQKCMRTQWCGVEKREILSHLINISSNQLFSNLCI